MKVWFDIDGVLYNTHEHIRNYVDTYYAKELWVWDKYDYRECDIPPHIKRLIKSLLYGSDLMYNRAPVLGARRLVERIARRHDVAIMTSRSEKNAYRTRSMIRRDFGDYTVHFSGWDKAKFLRDNGVDVYFEDCLDIVKSINASGRTRSVLVAQPYNNNDSVLRYVITKEGRLKNADI